MKTKLKKVKINTNGKKEGIDYNLPEKNREMTEVKPVKGWADLYDCGCPDCLPLKGQISGVYIIKPLDIEVIPVLITPLKVCKKIKKK